VSECSIVSEVSCDFTGCCMRVLGSSVSSAVNECCIVPEVFHDFIGSLYEFSR